MCGEPPKRALAVPPQFEGQVLPKGLAGHPEPAHIHETRCPQILIMPTDLADVIEFTHDILAEFEQSVQYVHFLAPRQRDDKANYAPLPAFRLHEGYDLNLWGIHHDDPHGDQRRIAAVARLLSDSAIAPNFGYRSNRSRRNYQNGSIGRGYGTCGLNPGYSSPRCR